MGIAVATLISSDRCGWAQAVQIQGIEAPEATVPERQSVGQRPRPDYDALGQRIGSFLFYPSADLQGDYNSNVFVTPTNTKSDFFASLKPSMTLTSDWNNNALNFHTDGEIRRYDQLVSENESNFEAATNGRLDIERDVYLTGGLGYQLAHEDRTSPSTVLNQKFPTLYQLGEAEASFVHEAGIVGAKLDGEILSYNYDNNTETTTTGGTATLPETYRDRMEYLVSPRLTYEYIPGYRAYIKAPVNWREYNAARDISGFLQDSHGYEIDAGTTVGLGQVLSGDVFAGYFSQTYAAAGTRNSLGVPYGRSPSGVTFGGNVLWNVTAIDSIRGTVARSVQETTVAPASSTVNTDVTVTGEHELLANVILSANLSYSNQDYQGIVRTDNIYGGGAGVRYLLNRYASTGLNVSYGERDSDTGSLPNTNGYKQTIVLANVHLQY